MKIVPLAEGERHRLRSLLDEHQPGDALACYYALHHPAARTRITAALSYLGVAAKAIGEATMRLALEPCFRPQNLLSRAQ